MPVSQQQLQQFIQALMGGQQQQNMWMQQQQPPQQMLRQAATQPQGMWASGMTQMPSGGGGGLGAPVAGYNPQAQMQWALQQEQQRNTPQMQQLMAEQQRRSAEARISMGQSPYNQQFIKGVDDWAESQPGYIPSQPYRNQGQSPMFQSGGQGQQQNPFMNSGFRTGGPDMMSPNYGPRMNTGQTPSFTQQQNPYMSAMGFGGGQQGTYHGIGNQNYNPWGGNSAAELANFRPQPAQTGGMSPSFTTRQPLNVFGNVGLGMGNLTDGSFRPLTQQQYLSMGGNQQYAQGGQQGMYAPPQGGAQQPIYGAGSLFR